MKINGYQQGQRIRPLEQITVSGAQAAAFSVTDGRGRRYAAGPIQGEFTFAVGGALGYHTIQTEDAAGQPAERLQFLVDAQTELVDAGGQYQELLDMLYLTMANNPEDHTIRFQNRLYYVLIPWLRDHVHTLKAMKYFTGRLYDGIDLYRDSQREDGMIWDNCHPRKPPFPGPDHWSVRFDYGGFFRLFDDCTNEFTRIPVENDVEYLFLEGLYYTWKATGDDAWMASSLPAARKALEYSATSPYRWSQKYGLLKRGHTIDTWDFQNEEDCLSDIVGWPDPMAILPEKTRFGVMFGDNTGYAAGCQYMAEMLEHLGQSEEAAEYRQRVEQIMARLDQVSWNGRFFTHHVPEDPSVQRNLGVDETTQVSLSNAYALNRPIRHEQAVAIIHTYQELKEHLPSGSPGEWFTIYPPFPKGYGGHNGLWQYMNASVTPIVAGELAHGAFQHGFETYGADILNRLMALGKQHGGVFHCSYTGAFPLPAERTLTPIPLSRDTKESLPVPLAEAIAARPLPTDPAETAGIPFVLPEGASAICLGPGGTREVVIPHQCKAGAVYFLHTANRLEPSRPLGTITLEYQDGSAATQYVINGREVLPWSHWEYWEPDAPARAIWRHPHPQHLNMQMTVYGLDNPHPEKDIVAIRLAAAQGLPSSAGWFVLALTASDGPVSFRANPISYGIPDSWGAAAVVYALVEGLAGVVDGGVTFDKVTLSPRWPAARVDQAQVTIRYPASTGYVSYQYQHQPEQKKIALILTGSGEQCEGHVLLPPEAVELTSLTVNGQDQPVRLEQVETSRYARVDIPVGAPCQVEIVYR